jgi:hypothetical protein
MSADPHRPGRRSLSERLTTGGWPLFALLIVVLAVIFGWMFLTVDLAGG